MYPSKTSNVHLHQSLECNHNQCTYECPSLRHGQFHSLWCHNLRSKKQSRRTKRAKRIVATASRYSFAKRSAYERAHKSDRTPVRVTSKRRDPEVGGQILPFSLFSTRRPVRTRFLRTRRPRSVSKMVCKCRNHPSRRSPTPFNPAGSQFSGS